VRRGRMVGTDLLPRFAQALPLDLFGMRVAGVPDVEPHEDLPQSRLHTELARRRVYLHPIRWTSLGLTVLEAMVLGMPVVGLAARELTEAVREGAGVVSTDIDRLVEALRHYAAEPEAARAAGRRGRRAVQERYGLARFLADWDRVLKGVAR
jgi:glycosyltransferase involved in cell wall biosynthesis